MSITLTHAQTALEAWLSADLAISRGQSYTMNGRSITLANLFGLCLRVCFVFQDVIIIF